MERCSSSCPAIFRRAAPPVSARLFLFGATTHRVDSADWVRLVPRVSTAVQPRRSACPLSGPGRLMEIGCSVNAPAPRSIQERVKPSGRVQGYRKKVGGALVGVSVNRLCPNTRQLTIGAPSRAPDGHACTAAASGTVRDFRGDRRDKHEDPSTSGLDGPVGSCVERGVHRGKTMYRCSGKCLTINHLRHLCDSHGSNGRPGRHCGRRRSKARSRGAGLGACVSGIVAEA